MFKNNLQQPRTLVSLHGFLSFCVLVGVEMDMTEDRGSQAQVEKKYKKRAGRAVFVFRVSILFCCVCRAAAVSKRTV